MSTLNEDLLREWLTGQQEALVRLTQEHRDGGDESGALRMEGGSRVLTRVIEALPQFHGPRKPMSEIAPPVQTRVRTNAPGTSWDAAISQTPTKSQRYYRVIYGMLLQFGPKTDDEIYDFLESRGKVVTQNTLRPRRKELTAEGWIRDSGTKRPSRMGKQSIVWEAVPEQ